MTLKEFVNELCTHPRVELEDFGLRNNKPDEDFPEGKSELYVKVNVEKARTTDLEQLRKGLRALYGKGSCIGVRENFKNPENNFVRLSIFAHPKNVTELREAHHLIMKLY